MFLESVNYTIIEKIPTWDIKVGFIERLVVVGIVIKFGREPVAESWTNEMLGVSPEFWSVIDGKL